MNIKKYFGLEVEIRNQSDPDTFGRFRKQLDISFAVSLVRQALPIALTQIMWGLKIYLPTVMLGLLIGGLKSL